MAGTLTLKDRISGPAFARGLMAVTLIYGLIFLYVLSQSGKTIRRMEEKLTVQTVSVERAEDLTTPEPEPEQAQDPVTVQVEETVAEPESISLRPAPMEGLIETTKAGQMPRISPEGLTPFMGYKKPFSYTGRPIIAIAITDYGLSEEISAAMLTSLPPEVSLIISPYSADPDKWQRLAREAGHEIWMHLPVETKKFPLVDPGPKALLATGSLQYNQDRLNWAMGRTPGYAGIAAETDEAIDGTGPSLQALLKNAFGRGLGFFEMNPKASPVIETQALAAKMPYTRSNLAMDEASPKMLEKLAADKGRSIGIFKPTPAGIKALGIWLDTLESKGIDLAPVSAVAEGQAERPAINPSQMEAIPVDKPVAIPPQEPLDAPHHE